MYATIVLLSLSERQYQCYFGGTVARPEVNRFHEASFGLQ